jgi:hypothetical protein
MFDGSRNPSFVENRRPQPIHKAAALVQSFAEEMIDNLGSSPGGNLAPSTLK